LLVLKEQRITNNLWKEENIKKRKVEASPAKRTHAKPWNITKGDVDSVMQRKEELLQEGLNIAKVKTMIKKNGLIEVLSHQLLAKLTNGFL